MSTFTEPPTPRVSLPRALHDFVVEMAIAVHKRSIYPQGHPIMMGAVESVYARLAELLQERADLAIGVAERRLIIDGVSSDGDHPLLSEFAGRLSDHLVGAFRFVRGVSREELDAFLDAAAQPVDEALDALGTRRDASSDHVTLLPIAFERLGLLEGQTRAIDDGREDATWHALAAAALRGDAAGGDALDPRVVAAAIGAGSADEGFDAAVIERLSHMLEELGVRGQGVTSAQRQRVTDLVASIGAPALSRLLQVGGVSRGARVVRTANDTLGSRAVLELVRAASSSEAVPISGAMLRLLQKLTTNAQQQGGRGVEADRVLRMSIRRLLDGWTLENPNPELYEKLLEQASTPETRQSVDRRRDVAEPERVVDICLEAQHSGPAPEAALSKLAMRDGLAGVIERLESYAPSPVRDALVDRVLNEASLREYLAQRTLDAPLLRQAVDHMKVRALDPLLTALDRRPADDGALISELLGRVGSDALEPLGEHLSGAPPRLLRHLLAVFDQLDAWPSQADPSYYATHPDVVVRREALKFLLKREATRASATLTAVRDREVSILGLGLGHVDATCPVDVATVLMSRYGEPELTSDVRVQVIRVAASSGTRDAEAWLGSLLLSRRWILGPRLRPPTPECIAAAAALVGHFRESPLAQQVVALAQRGRAVEYRRAVYRPARGAA